MNWTDEGICDECSGRAYWQGQLGLVQCWKCYGTGRARPTREQLDEARARMTQACEPPQSTIRDDCCEEAGEDLVFADGFESAIIGVAKRAGQPTVVVYDHEECLQLLMERDGMAREDAEEHMAFNVTGAWVGEQTPLFVRRVK